MDTLDIAVASLTFLSVREKKLLRHNLLEKNLDSGRVLAVLSIEDISRMVGRPVRTSCWSGEAAWHLALQSATVMERLGIGAVRVDEPGYPALLAESFDPPYLLFYRGGIAALQKECVSVVGTRRVSAQGARAALAFSADAARAGLTVVSGLANGVDSFAHRGALSACAQADLSAVTAAVLPCGIDMVVPAGNRGLARQVVEHGGCLASEYPPGTPPEPWRFVQRNRIVAALSQGTLVVQAPPGSGALITADFALGYGRDVVLHEACFADDAGTVPASPAKAARRTVERYREDGAPVVRTFAEFARILAEGPVACNKNDGQQDLFVPVPEKEEK